tara:strand:+ start:146 stop:358 length:213 start_codon:yes stop_codon:yes gene_type:complete
MSEVEAGGEEDWGFAGAETIIDEHGWRQRAPISDDMCIYQSLCNSEYLCGLDKKQVHRLIEEYKQKCDLE